MVVVVGLLVDGRAKRTETRQQLLLASCGEQYFSADFFCVRGTTPILFSGREQKERRHNENSESVAVDNLNRIIYYQVNFSDRAIFHKMPF